MTVRRSPALEAADPERAAPALVTPGPALSASVAAGEPWLVIAWALADAPDAGTARADADDLVRHVVGEVCAVDAGDVAVARVCPGCGSREHGRPVATVAGRRGPHVSISRAGGLVCVAVTDAGPVGVDVELSGAAGFGDFATVGLHPLERSRGAHEQTRTWVRKEALVKATGDGLRLDLRRIRLTELATHPALVSWDERPPAGPVWMRDVDGPRGYVLAVSVLTALDPQVTVVEARVGAAPAAELAAESVPAAVAQAARTAQGR